MRPAFKLIFSLSLDLRWWQNVGSHAFSSLQSKSSWSQFNGQTVSLPQCRKQRYTQLKKSPPSLVGADMYMVSRVEVGAGAKQKSLALCRLEPKLKVRGMFWKVLGCTPPSRGAGPFVAS